MHRAEILPFDSELELSEGLYKGHALDISDGAAKLEGNRESIAIGNFTSLMPVFEPT